MRSACAVLQSICFRLQTKGGCRCPPARGNGAFLQARTFKEPGDLKVCPAVPFPSLSVSHLPCRDLGFHRREAGHASLSEVLQALHSDLELHLKPGPPAGYCTGVQMFTPCFIWVTSLSFSLFNASGIAENRTALTVLLSTLSITRDSA